MWTKRDGGFTDEVANTVGTSGACVIGHMKPVLAPFSLVTSLWKPGPFCPVTEGSGVSN